MYFGNCDKRGNEQILYFFRQRASCGVARRWDSLMQVVYARAYREETMVFDEGKR